MRCVRCKATDGGTQLCADCRRELRHQRRDSGEISQLFEESIVSLQQGELNTAVRTLQKLLRRDPQHLAAYENLILSYGILGKLDRAAATFVTMHHVGPSVVEPAVMKSKSEKKVVSSRSRDRAMTAGLKPQKAPPLGEAEAARTRRGQTQPPNGESHGSENMLGLALFYRQLHQLELAEQVLATVKNAGVDLPEAHLILGSVYRAQGKPRQALTELKKARVGGGAEHAAVAYETGLCHEMLGHLKRANSNVSTAIALEPDNPHMHLSLGMLYEKQGRSRLARRAYRVASSLNQAFAPALADISFRLGLSALEEGNLERALTEFGAGVTENPHLFAPAVLTEIEHLIAHLIEAEQFSNFVDESNGLQQMPEKVLAGIEEVFAVAARLAFFVGLSYYWDSYYETHAHEGDDASDVYGPLESSAAAAWQYEPVEPEATWLEGVGPSGCVMLRGASISPWRGRRAHSPMPDSTDETRTIDETAGVRARLARAETLLGFPPVQFEFIFEEWLNVQQMLASPRVAERPLVSPEIYQRLLSILAAAMQRMHNLLVAQGVTAVEDEHDEGQDNADLGMALWATIIESFLLRNALERCRSFPREFLVRLATADRYRQRRQFARAIRELEAAVPLMEDNASVHNFLWNLYIREGRYQEAIEHCHAVVRSTSHYLFQAAAYNDLAYCMVELGQNLNLALLYTEKARELAPSIFDAHVADTKAWLNWKEGRFDEALRLIEEVIEAGYSDDHALLPTSIHFYHYGHILQSLGREAEAQEAFATAREMEVDSESDWGITRRLQRERKKTR